MTHDLRTPLTSIKASVTTLIAEERTPRNVNGGALGREGREEMLEVIDEEADRLDRFIEGLMELARIDAGELRLEKRRASISEILSAATKRAQPRTSRHRVQLSPARFTPVSVDEAVWSKCFMSCLIMRLSIPRRNHDHDFGLARYTEFSDVADEGCGIAPQLRERF